MEVNRERCAVVKSEGRTVATRPGWYESNHQALHNSVDGHGLRVSNDVPGLNRWRTDGSLTMSGRNFVGAIQLASGTLRTRLRAARGFPDADIRCDCCGRVESLSHVMQVCPRTWSSRIRRHDRAVDLIGQKFKQKGFQVVHEPRIITTRGYRKPDLVLFKPGVLAAVLDVTVLGDNADLSAEHDLKSDFYDLPEVRKYVARLAELSEKEVTMGGVALTWRGAFSQKSKDFLLSLGLEMEFLQLIVIRVLEGGFHIYEEFNLKDSLAMADYLIVLHFLQVLFSSCSVHVSFIFDSLKCTVLFC